MNESYIEEIKKWKWDLVEDYLDVKFEQNECKTLTLRDFKKFLHEGIMASQLRNNGYDSNLIVLFRSILIKKFVLPRKEIIIKLFSENLAVDKIIEQLNVKRRQLDFSIRIYELPYKIGGKFCSISGCDNHTVDERKMCEEHLIVRKGRDHTRNKNKKENKICRFCTNPVCGESDRLCQSHFDEERRKRKETIRQWISEGLCKKCGKDKEVKESKRCRECSLRRLARKHLGSETHWQILNNMYIKQNGKCYYSHIDIKLGINASIDHIKPVSKFPSLKYDINNMVFAHYNYNMGKKTMSKEKFIDLLEETRVALNKDKEHKMPEINLYEIKGFNKFNSI